MILEVRRSEVWDIPFIISSLHAWNASTSATETNWNNIIAAQEAVGTTMPSCYYLDNSGVSAPDVHLNATGAAIVGLALATLIHDNFY
jgi:hypothetical protein